jgi:hypothetical protein
LRLRLLWFYAVCACCRGGLNAKRFKATQTYEVNIVSLAGKFCLKTGVINRASRVGR